MSSIPEVAMQAAKYFTTDKRDNGEEFIKINDDTPKWVREMVRVAHGDMFPNDWRYKAIVLDSISAAGYGDEFNVADRHEITDYLVNVTTHDLLTWVASRNDRSDYVNEAMREYPRGDDFDLIQALQMGQYAEYDEIFSSVLESLQKQLDGEVE